MTSLFISLGFIEGLGGGEMVLVFVIVLLLFGGKKMPEFARGMGKSIREFKKAASGVEEEFKRAIEEDEKTSAAQAFPLAGTSATILPPAPVTPALTEASYHPPLDVETSSPADGPHAAETPPAAVEPVSLDATASLPPVPPPEPKSPPPSPPPHP
jgi:TatA/E family protein of Tat protein translocase